ncbi:hypothetical protein [Flavobacterium sp.]|nr:hypothetical protein [Flavobacterium sp.]
MRLNDEQKFRIGQLILTVLMWLGIGLAFYFLYEYIMLCKNE